MGLTVRVVCRPAIATGFELAGLRVIRAADGMAAADMLRGLLADAHSGVVLVDEGLYRVLPHDLLSRFERQALPVLAPIPVPTWDARGTAEGYVLEILRQAIGYRVRPR